MGIGLTILYLVILLLSAVVHEVAHGVVALIFGDSTARDRGRISLNPLRHIEPFFSVILPLMLVLSQSPIFFAAAKPVPVAVERLRPRRLGLLCVALAGPLSNMLLVVGGAVALRLITTTQDPSQYQIYLAKTIYVAVVTNLGLAFFNLFPVPPLDGGQILGCLLPARLANLFFRLSRYGLSIVVLLLLSGVIDRYMRTAMDLGLSVLMQYLS